MAMNRREILRMGAAAAAASAMLPRAALAQNAFVPRPGAWRSFQTVTRLEIAKSGAVGRSGKVFVWRPAAPIIQWRVTKS